MPESLHAYHQELEELAGPPPLRNRDGAVVRGAEGDLPRDTTAWCAT